MKNSSVFLIVFLFFFVDIKAQRKNKSISQSINYEIPNLIHPSIEIPSCLKIGKGNILNGVRSFVFKVYCIINICLIDKFINEIKSVCKIKEDLVIERKKGILKKPKN